MPVYPSSAEGFTLLEALVALAVLGAVLVVGLETIGLGAAARARAAEHAVLRTLAANELAEVRAARARELRRMLGESEGHFGAKYRGVTWWRRLTEEEPGSGLFHVEIEVRHGSTAVRAETYVNRFADLWAQTDAMAR